MANLARSGAKSSSPPCKKKNQVPHKRSERAGREKREEEIDQEREIEREIEMIHIHTHVHTYIHTCTHSGERGREREKRVRTRHIERLKAEKSGREKRL